MERVSYHWYRHRRDFGPSAVYLARHPPIMAGNPRDRLISAIREGDIGTVKSLLDRNPYLGLPRREIGPYDVHFLCESLLYDQEDIAKLLILRGADVNKRQNYFCAPLHLAVQNDYAEVVSMLLEKGSPVDARDAHNKTALHLAVETENLEIIELLLKKMANIEAKSRDGLTPLHMAVNMLDREQTSEDYFDHALASRCKLCTSNLEVTTNPTDATKTDTSGEEVAKLLLDRGADVDALNIYGKNVLQVAVERGNFRIIEQILLSRVAANGLVSNDCLSIAVKSAEPADRRVVELLVDWGFTLNSRDAKHNGLLHNAVRNGYTKIVDDLLKLEADVEATHEIASGGTLLHSSAVSGQIRIAELLIERGADVNAKDKKNKTPILYAVENMDPDMTKLLLMNGANDKGTPSLLHTAAEQGCSHIMEMILEKMPRINVNAVDGVASMRLRFLDIVRGWRSAGVDECMVTGGYNYKLTALHVAAAGGFARIVELLLEHNANVCSLEKHVGTPLHCSVVQRDVAIVEMLLLKGAKVDAKREDGMTPLHLAVREGNTKAFEVLIEHGADVHKRNNKGLNLVHMATEHGHLRIFEDDLLDVLKAGHPKTNDGLTALQMAVRMNSLENVEILLRHGADASVEDNDGESPLHYAAFRDTSGRVVEALLNRLDDIDTKDINGRTALHEAAYARNFEAVRLLLFHGCDFNIKDEFGNLPHEIVNQYEPTIFPSWQRITEHDRRQAGVRMMEECIVKMMVLGFFANPDDRRSLYLSSAQKDIADKCVEEIESMKITKIGESRVSFYEFLTTSYRQLAIYSKYRNIAGFSKMSDHTDTFKLYSDMIDWRFRKAKMINDLIDSSVRSLSTLFGYALSDYDYMEIIGYLDRRDLENVIKAGASVEKSKKEEIFNSRLDSEKDA